MLEWWQKETFDPKTIDKGQATERMK